MPWHTIGLVVFIASVFANIMGLVFDLALRMSGIPTITDAVEVRWWVAIPIVINQVIGTAGLLLHFYSR